jgi:orotate phosphoribosyltransferase-like protein
MAKKGKKRDRKSVEKQIATISNKVICPFYKKKDWKQSDKHGDERKGIYDVIGVDFDMIKDLKKVVIIDDIYSTGNTIKSCIRHINSKCDIKVLCICRNVLKK